MANFEKRNLGFVHSAMYKTVVQVSARCLHSSQARYASTSSQKASSSSRVTSGSTPIVTNPPADGKHKTGRFGKIGKKKDPAKKTKIYIPGKSDSFERFTDSLMRAAVKEEDKFGWKHMPSLRGDEMRLKRKVEKIPGLEPLETIDSLIGEPSSFTQVAFDAAVPVEQLENEEFSWIPEAPLGSFIEVRR